VFLKFDIWDFVSKDYVFLSFDVGDIISKDCFVAHKLNWFFESLNNELLAMTMS